MSAAETCGQTPELTTDKLLGQRITIVQPARGFRAGSDSLLLAASVPARPGERVLEAGIGPGGAAMALLARVEGVHLTGIESEAEHAELAIRNARENGFAQRCEVIQCTIAEATTGELKSRGVEARFDHTMANPPFFESGRVRASDNASRRAGNMGEAGQLGTWVARLADATKGGGTVTMIHRAGALGEVVAAFVRHVGGPDVLPITAHPGDDATRAIVQARKGSRAEPRLMAPLVMHCADGSYTDEAEDVLRHGAALDFRSSPVSITAAMSQEK